MDMRDYFREALDQYRATGSDSDRREAVRRAWDNSDACAAMGDREASFAWEDIAVEVRAGL